MMMLFNKNHGYSNSICVGKYIYFNLRNLAVALYIQYSDTF